MDEDKFIEQGFSQLDKLLEHRSRLAIMCLLLKYDQIAFRRFKSLLNETDGNLGAQLRKLEDAGYIKVEKRFENRKPVSWYSICTKGRVSTRKHIAALNTLFDA